MSSFKSAARDGAEGPSSAGGGGKGLDRGAPRHAGFALDRSGAGGEELWGRRGVQGTRRERRVRGRVDGRLGPERPAPGEERGVRRPVPEAGAGLGTPGGPEGSRLERKEGKRVSRG